MTDDQPQKSDSTAKVYTMEVFRHDVDALVAERDALKARVAELEKTQEPYFSGRVVVPRLRDELAVAKAEIERLKDAWSKTLQRSLEIEQSRDRANARIAELEQKRHSSEQKHADDVRAYEKQRAQVELALKAHKGGG